MSRLGADLVDKKLDTALERLIRREKYASAMIVSLRIARELEEPLAELDRHIALLQRIAGREPAIRPVLESLRRDRHLILNVLSRLGALEPPVEPAA